SSTFAGRTSQRYCQKPTKELDYTNARTVSLCSKNEREIMRKMNNETLTKCMCHKGFSGYSNILARSNFGVFRQESSPQSLTAHTLDR
ncbi:MAG: hypothetical protein ACK4EX_11655, partial [Thermaurantimonas sp.]|uniref:hypothetical protein n=1 Tax=Thermaurantimonas sp. TaxID=2681568 RepID=UPI00391B8710